MSHQSDSVVALFDRIAPVYDRLNRIISWGQDRRWRRELARRMELKSDQVVLDVSVGTGDMALALREVCSQVRVFGADPSLKMISRYRSKSAEAPVSLGVAELLPFRSETVSRVVCAFGLRNFVDRAAAFAEIHRILKPGGLWGFLEMSAPTGRLFPILYDFYFKRLVPLIGAAISLRPYAYQYLRDSVYVFPGFKGMREEHLQAGFKLIFYRPILRAAVGLYVFEKNTENR